MPTLEKKLSKLTPTNRIKELECLVEKQALMIERLRSTKVSLPVGGKKQEHGEGTYLRVVCGDTHGAHIDKAAAKAFLNDLEILKPAEFIHLGDALDCSGFLAQHHVLGVVPECDITFEQDVLSSNDFLDKVQARLPAECDIDLILGNHDWRIEKTVIKWVMQNAVNARFLLSMCGPAKVMNLEQRGIRCIRPDTFYDGLNVHGTVKKFKCKFRHGMRTGANATRQILDDFGCNVVHGHTHRMMMATRETIDGLIAAWCPGCLCELRPLYGMTNISGWSHGYLIQCVSKKGFITIQVPIINGVSYLQPLVQHLNIK